MEYFLYKRYSAIPDDEWNELLTDKNFFISPSCVQVLEAEHENEIEPIYIVIKEQSKVIGIVYAQLFLINGAKLNEYIVNSTGGFSLVNKIKEFLANKISVKVGFLGNVFLSNEASFKILQPEVDKRFLPDVLNLIVEETEAKFILIPEFFEPSISLLGANCKEIYVEPDMHLAIPESWRSFSDYVEAISSKYKKRYRSVLKKSSVLEKRDLSPSNLKHESARMKELFFNVYSKSKFNAAKFNTDVFYDLKLIEKNVSIFGYYHEDKLVGFASEITIRKTLYSHFVGIDYEYNNQFEIYNRMLFEQIEFAIKNNLEQIKFGRTASEFKSTIGAVPYKGYGYVYHPCKSIIKAISPILSMLKPKDWTQRHPFKTV